MSKLLKSLVATFMIFALGAPAIASASDSLEGTAVKVSFADLNIEKAAGAKALYHRLQSAAKEACGVESLKNEGSVKQIAQSRSCYRKALDSAVAKIGNENVSNIHTG